MRFRVPLFYSWTTLAWLTPFTSLLVYLRKEKARGLGFLETHDSIMTVLQNHSLLTCRTNTLEAFLIAFSCLHVSKACLCVYIQVRNLRQPGTLLSPSPFHLLCFALFSSSPRLLAMVHLSIFDPVRRLKQIVHLMHGRSKPQVRQLTGRGSPSKSVLDHALPSPAADHLTSPKNSSKFATHDALYDDTYYPSTQETRGDEESYCTLMMENTLFKVTQFHLV